MKHRNPRPSPRKPTSRKDKNFNDVNQHSAFHAECRLGATWGNPSKQHWLAQLLISWLFHDPESFRQEELLLLAAVHQRLDAFTKLPWAPFIYTRIVATLSNILMELARREASTLTSDHDPAVQRFLTEISWFVEEDRVFGSMRAQYLQAVASGTISVRFSSVDARIERHRRKIPVPRIRGYRDKGSLRPAHQWLPPPPPVEEGYPTESTSVPDLERFLKQLKE